MKSFRAARYPRLVRLWRLLAVAALIAGTTSVFNLSSTMPVSAAGEDLRIKSLSLNLWPEYDDPRLLVIYQGEFTDGGTFPREVRFRAPINASIQMACALTPKQEHLCQVYDTIVEGDYKMIVFTLPIPTFFFEYYVEQISRTEGSTDTSINYQFVNPPYAIDSLEMEIQQPLKATNFTINPSSSTASADNQGFKYFNYRYSNVPADKSLDFAISYTKTDPNPSVQKKTDATAAAQSQSNSLIAMGAIGGLAAILGGYYYVTKKNKQQKRYMTRAMSTAKMRQPGRGAVLQKEGPPPRPVYRGISSETEPTHPRASETVFCSICGTRLEASDVFCYKCGQLVPQRGGAAKVKRN